MQSDAPIYIKVTPARDVADAWLQSAASIPPGRDWHAQFACLVEVTNAEELSESRWGFNAGALLEEALDRQLLFVEAQHFPYDASQPDETAQRTFALRCVKSRNANTLQLALIGKICAGTETAAYVRAANYCHELCSTFPWDYRLIPATDERTFAAWAGWDVIEAASTPLAFAELQRHEFLINLNDGAEINDSVMGANRTEILYMVSDWSFSKFANEMIWRVLNGLDRPMLYDVQLRPTCVYDDELEALGQALQLAEHAAANDRLASTRQYAAYAVETFKKMLASINRPYLAQIRLVSTELIPEYVWRTIGSALTHRDDAQAAVVPGFQVAQPLEAEIASWKTDLIWLEPDMGGIPSRPVEFTRLFKMVDAHLGSALFRPPYPRNQDWPPVQFRRSSGRHE